MAVFAQRVTFILNKKCNAHCPFCIQHSMKGLEDLPDDEIFSNFIKCIDHIEGITNINVQLMGGEPTLWSPYLIHKIQDRLEKYERYMIFTNGADKNSEWYKDKKALFLWHVTDWDDVRVLEWKDNEQPKIVVTHKNIDRLEEFLEVNYRLNRERGITISPCVESGELTATPEDIIRIAELQVKTESRYKNMVLLAECLKRGNMGNWRQACKRFETTWNVDCQTMTVEPCCGNNYERKLYPLEEFTGQKPEDCGNCVYAL